MIDRNLIRNFCIVAHIDHGKSTLADRLLDITGAVSGRDRRAQFLDNMDLERERGITIKAQTARIPYRARDGTTYVLNLIDTPGHVDFSYEVSRALEACEGALLVVDAAQGIEAQTLANAYLAVDAGLEVIPVVNKIDLPSADPDKVAEEIEDVIGLDAADVLPVSAKTGDGIEELLERIVECVPPPGGDPAAPTRALVFDSWFDPYVGATILVRVVDGELRRGEKIRMMAQGIEKEISNLHVVDPSPRRVDSLAAGEVGVVVAGIKTLAEVKIGDTLTSAAHPAEEPLPGFQEVKPMVFAGLYPVDSDGYESLKAALEKLQLNDASLIYEPETSDALGFGFRCGFLGFLHAEIVQERLEREYDVDLISTAPTVRYRIGLASGETVEIESPADLPSAGELDGIEEPIVLATIHVPQEYVGGVLALCQDRRGSQRDMVQHGSRVQVRYDLPLSEIVLDFHDKIKSVTRGYGSFDYELTGYQRADLVKLDVLVNGDPVDALSLIVHRDKAYGRGTELVRKLKEFIPRQMYEVAIQAAIGARVVARMNVKALRKNVTSKCYGGDITRKRKLLEKQKEGKRRMKKVGSVEIPQEAFLAALKLGGLVSDGSNSESFWEQIRTILIAVLIALAIRSVIVEPFRIPSGSMLPTLLIGDHLFVNKFVYGPKIPFTDQRLPGFRDPERGDIIVFTVARRGGDTFPADRHPDLPREEFVKRIVGLPGDRVEFRNGQVLVNGEAMQIDPLNETFQDGAGRVLDVQQVSLDTKTYRVLDDPNGDFRAPRAVTTVEADRYLVLGDNRDYSKDSRVWGTVRKAEIKGPAFILYWSWDFNGGWLELLNPLTWWNAEKRWDRIGAGLE